MSACLSSELTGVAPEDGVVLPSQVVCRRGEGLPVVVGSSRRRQAGEVSSSAAMATLLLAPPDTPLVRHPLSGCEPPAYTHTHTHVHEPCVNIPGTLARCGPCSDVGLSVLSARLTAAGMYVMADELQACCLAVEARLQQWQSVCAMCVILWSRCVHAVVTLWPCCGHAVVMLWSCYGRAVIVLCHDASCCGMSAGEPHLIGVITQPHSNLL